MGAPVPLESKAYPAVPDAVEAVLVAPEKYNTPPWVPVANPVPPLLVANVPPKTNVPEDVIGPPVKVKPVELPLAATLVTVPEVVVAQDKAPEPLLVKTPAELAGKECPNQLAESDAETLLTAEPLPVR